jgi:hypothetical protein
MLKNSAKIVNSIQDILDYKILTNEELYALADVQKLVLLCDELVKITTVSQAVEKERLLNKVYNLLV